MRQQSIHQSSGKPQRGFSLIEALIALLVVSFGLLAIASFQFTLARSSDLAKQRSEATRLAQQKMEQLRSYARVQSHTGAPHIVNYQDDVVSGSEILSAASLQSNAEYTRTWDVTANAADTEKWVNVAVDWRDRTNTAQQVRLFSVISKYDPQDLGSLSTFVPGVAGNQRRPKNRNINVPYPAVTLASCPGGSGACSAFTPPPGNVIYVFDNNTGNITGSCAPVTYPISTVSGTGTTVTVTMSAAHTFAVGDRVTIAGSGLAAANGTFTVVTTASPAFTYSVSTSFTGTQTGNGGTVSYSTTLTEGMDLSTAGGLTCTNFQAYLLSGFVRFDTSNNPAGDEPGTIGSNNNTLPLNSTTPLSLDISNQSGGTPSMTCYAQQQKVVTTNSSAVTITSVTRSGNRVTVTAAGHGYANDNVIAINQVTPAGFNGAFVVTVTSSSQFTYDLPAAVATGLPTSGGVTGAFAKQVERLTVPETTSVAGYGGVSARFVSYACIVTPVDHDGNGTTPLRWWGSITLNPNGWTIGNGGSEYRVCRYSADYGGVGGAGSANSEHPLWYRGVTGALDSQNFLITQGRACPTDQPQNLGSPFNPSDDSTVAHQPNASRSGGEPSQTSADIPMD